MRRLNEIVQIWIMNILLLVTSIVVSLSSAQVVKSADELYNCPIEEVEKLVTEWVR